MRLERRRGFDAGFVKMPFRRRLSRHFHYYILNKMYVRPTPFFSQSHSALDIDSAYE